MIHQRQRQAQALAHERKNQALDQQGQRQELVLGKLRVLSKPLLGKKLVLIQLLLLGHQGKLDLDLQLLQWDPELARMMLVVLLKLPLSLRQLAVR